MYERRRTISVNGKDIIKGTSEFSVAENKIYYNPEELLVASVSACHMMWYLYLCAQKNIVITSYIDNAEGTMISEINKGGKFEQVILKPQITVQNCNDDNILNELHEEANILCYIANSCNFPVLHQPVYIFN